MKNLDLFSTQELGRSEMVEIVGGQNIFGKIWSAIKSHWEDIVDGFVEGILDGN